MPHLLLNVAQLHLLQEIRQCTGQEDPFEAIDEFINQALHNIQQNWLTRLQWLALINLGVPLNQSVGHRHFDPKSVARLLNMRPRDWEMSVAALREVAEKDLAATETLACYDGMFCDWVTIGAMVALMTHYNIPIGIESEHAHSCRPVLGYFLSSALKRDMIVQTQIRPDRELGLD